MHHPTCKFKKILGRLKKSESRNAIKIPQLQLFTTEGFYTALFVSETKSEARHLAPIKYLQVLSNQINLPGEVEGKEINNNKKTPKNEKPEQRTTG